MYVGYFAGGLPLSYDLDCLITKSTRKTKTTETLLD